MIKRMGGADAFFLGLDYLGGRGTRWDPGPRRLDNGVHHMSFATSIPRNASGKILERVLREHYA